MDVTITPAALHGTVQALPSKSQVHRLLLCAALADAPTYIGCAAVSRDMEATAACLRALGAQIDRDKRGYRVSPIVTAPQAATLFCRDSGTTLRLLLPIVGALGVDATFVTEGRLAQRPLSPLWEELERMGCRLSRPAPQLVRICGRLRPGEYRIDGGVSSQFVSGLLFAAAILREGSTVRVDGALQSKPYVELTERALRLFDAPAFHSPGTVEAEGDWSNAAFFLTARALGSEVDVRGLDPHSAQGDRAIATLLPMLDASAQTICAADIPDLVPSLAVFAAARHGAVFTDIRRLRLKESDRVRSVIGMLRALGARAFADENTLTVRPAALTGGTVDACDDHRIAMAAAIASTVCTAPVTVLGAQCVEKSYPDFWEEFVRLGGKL